MFKVNDITAFITICTTPNCSGGLHSTVAIYDSGFFRIVGCGYILDTTARAPWSSNSTGNGRG
jgi:hypothetical protein